MAVSASGRTSTPIMVVSSLPDERRAAVAAQLEERYAATYEVVPVATSSQAADALRTAANDGRQVAILLADDPGRAGRRAARSSRSPHELFPDVRRGLLVEWGAWGDRDTADLVLTLMAQGQIDYYVIRPWHSPDEYFHRTITEFLVEWDRAVGLRPREVSVVGDPASARSHEVRRLLANNGIPHQFVPSAEPEAGELLAGAGPRARRVHRRSAPRRSGAGRPDERRAGSCLRAGGRRAGRLGVRPRRRRRGAGRTRRRGVRGRPRDCARSWWNGSRSAARPGSSSLIRNYLGFARGISGAELAQRAYQQAWVFGCSFAHSRAAVSLDDGRRRVRRGHRAAVAPSTRPSVVLATGVSYRRLGVAELLPYESAGVYYGASGVRGEGRSGRSGDRRREVATRRVRRPCTWPGTPAR